MRLSRLGPVGQEIPTVEVDETSYDLRPITDDIDGAFLSLDGVQRTRDALASGILSELANARTLRIGAPLGAPGKIVCIGLNYRDHVQETRAETPMEPVIFMKDPSTIVGPNDTVYIPRASMKTDWEVELGVVIGTTARYLDSRQMRGSTLRATFFRTMSLSASSRSSAAGSGTRARAARPSTRWAPIS